jgi:hypothetical protein
MRFKYSPSRRIAVTRGKITIRKRVTRQPSGVALGVVRGNKDEQRRVED